MCTISHNTFELLSIGTCRGIEWRCPDWNNWDLMSKISMGLSQFCNVFFCVDRNAVFDKLEIKGCTHCYIAKRGRRLHNRVY